MITEYIYKNKKVLELFGGGAIYPNQTVYHTYDNWSKKIIGDKSIIVKLTPDSAMFITLNKSCLISKDKFRLKKINNILKD
jgi:hypothetical protein